MLELEGSLETQCDSLIKKVKQRLIHFLDYKSDHTHRNSWKVWKSFKNVFKNFFNVLGS